MPSFGEEALQPRRHGPEDPESSDSEDSPKVPLRRADHRPPGQRLFRSEAAAGLGDTSATLSPASSMAMCNSTLQLEETAWGVSRNGDQEWHYVELGDRRGSCKGKFRRALFCRPAYENRQRLLAFARDQILQPLPASSRCHSARLSGTGSRLHCPTVRHVGFIATDFEIGEDRQICPPGSFREERRLDLN